MDRATKPQFIKQFETLIQKTDELANVSIEYGFIKNDVFIPSERELTNVDDPREMLKISYGTSPNAIIYRSVEADSCYAVMLDAMKGIEELRKYYR